MGVTQEKLDVGLWDQGDGSGAIILPLSGVRIDPGTELIIDLRDPAPASGLFGASRLELALKRVVDVVGAGLLLVMLAPLMLLTAMAIKLSSPGPVFFSQERIGLLGERFRILKFRSMFADADEQKKDLLEQNQYESGPVFKLREDPRMTPVGRLIRRFSIDELPQFAHVLRGEMSLVGPRPLPYGDVISHVSEDLLTDPTRYTSPELRRLLAKPGITGIWQVSGRSELDYETWMAMDVDYIENWSLWLDLKLLARTVPTVLSGRGAF